MKKVHDSPAQQQGPFRLERRFPLHQSFRQQGIRDSRLANVWPPRMTGRGITKLPQSMYTAKNKRQTKDVKSLKGDGTELTRRNRAALMILLSAVDKSVPGRLSRHLPSVLLSVSLICLPPCPTTGCHCSKAVV